MGSPAGAEPSTACRGRPYPRSRSSRIAVIRAVSLLAFTAKRASSAIAEGHVGAPAPVLRREPCVRQRRAVQWELPPSCKALVRFLVRRLHAVAGADDRATQRRSFRDLDQSDQAKWQR